MTLKKLTAVLLFCLLGAGVTTAQNANEQTIENAISKSNISTLAALFNSTIDLEVEDTDGNYSKKQAEMIIRDFFDSNPVKSFKINHKGSSNDGSKYMIGTYQSTNGKSFRVNILLKKTEEKLKIHQLQFEKD